MGLETLSQILRDGDRGRLRDELRATLTAGSREWALDERDLMWTLGPYHDCARRLGMDPAALFDEVADAVPGVAETVRVMGRRRDVRPRNFGFAIDKTPDGPSYRWT